MCIFIVFITKSCLQIARYRLNNWLIVLFLPEEILELLGKSTQTLALRVPFSMLRGRPSRSSKSSSMSSFHVAIEQSSLLVCSLFRAFLAAIFSVVAPLGSLKICPPLTLVHHTAAVVVGQAALAQALALVTS